MADRIRVLICDDVAMLRELLRYELEEDDDLVVVGEADNGVDGVRLVQALRPNVVVLDLAMPGIDGLEAMRRIKTEVPGMPIVIASAHSMASDRERFLAAGADNVLSKPFRLADLISIVQALASAK